jgi:hypothetical protein
MSRWSCYLVGFTSPEPKIVAMRIFGMRKLNLLTSCQVVGDQRIGVSMPHLMFGL